jgi:hypothetical protein
MHAGQKFYNSNGSDNNVIVWPQGVDVPDTRVDLIPGGDSYKVLKEDGKSFPRQEERRFVGGVAGAPVGGEDLLSGRHRYDLLPDRSELKLVRASLNRN